MGKKVKKLDKYSDLQVILQNELPINAARIKFIVLIMTSLLKVQNVNYQRLAEGFDNDVELPSTLRRIQRFFALFDLNSDLVARLLYKLLPNEVFSNGKIQLTLDRTNWKFGVININILMLGVIYKGVALPLLWTFLGDKRGNSDQKERIALMERFIQLFGVESIDFLTADREFIGDDWWNFLIFHKIRFFIRLRANMQVSVPSKGIVKAYWLFNYFGFNKSFSHPTIVKIGSNWVCLSGLKFINQEGKIEFLIVASFTQIDNHIALEIYRKRWQIETMFKAFKTGGFNFENTHLTDYQRLNKLLLIAAIAFLWAYKVGIYRNDNIKKIKTKNHGRLAQSIFSYGLEFLAQALINFFPKRILLLTIAFLSCT
jgi:hypothetical protein